jgi:hypothetical protein
VIRVTPTIVLLWIIVRLRASAATDSYVTDKCSYSSIHTTRAWMNGCALPGGDISSSEIVDVADFGSRRPTLTHGFRHRLRAGVVGRAAVWAGMTKSPLLGLSAAGELNATPGSVSTRYTALPHRARANPVWAPVRNRGRGRRPPFHWRPHALRGHGHLSHVERAMWCAV